MEGKALHHGNQVLERVIRGYDSERRFHQSHHTPANVWQAMDTIFQEPETSRLAKFRIAEYLIPDALIKSTDRHHENWGILLEHVDGH